ncbi:hypothetical protein CERZMDRAFT_92551 [Cercospora zeae-maydis SCOH1-5]|uniref:Fumarate lyase N-terminal domain-containing protein n=1 Tax=Cercospora zeae-maydis SCOH1-5 TaxID=717836 RepID=A0A6A6FWU9_9PEZI|nr:hypothetical protein CERZMDRAFT_92551 [Cercospora zeae-maydis SCOH1-5]
MPVSVIDSFLFKNMFGTQAVRDMFEDSKYLDHDRLGRETDIVGYPILPLIRQLSEACGEEAGKYVHWGATQDFQDTAAILQMKDGLDLVEEQLKAIIKTLSSLAEGHRDTPMAGRTHLQHALPITFGYKCAVYLSSFQRHLPRLYELRPRCLLVQFGGSLGKLATDLMVMSSNECNEVSEPFVPHRGASSTMPQESNPISSEVILAASKLLRANAG